MLQNTITGEVYTFQRASTDLKSIIYEFQDDFLKEFKKVPLKDRKLFATSLLKLIRSFKQPTKNQESILEFMDDFITNFPIPKYFFYSTMHNQKTEQLTLIPELFSDLSTFGNFLNQAELIIRIQLHPPRVETQLKPKATLRAIAYAITFQLESQGKNGRTLNEYFQDWTNKISREYQSRKTRSIEQAYHRLEDNISYKKKFKSDIIQAISLLKGDDMAIRRGQACLKTITD